MTVAVLACMLACLAHIAAGPIAARPNWLGAAIGNSLNLRLLTPAVPLRPKLEGKPTPVVQRTPATPCATLRARGCSAGGAPPETQKPTPVPTKAPTRPPPTPSPTTPATMRPTSLAPTFSALIDPCAYQNDGICDVPSYCTVGDYLDCSTDPRGLLGTALPRSRTGLASIPSRLYRRSANARSVASSGR